MGMVRYRRRAEFRNHISDRIPKCCPRYRCVCIEYRSEFFRYMCVAQYKRKIQCIY